MEFVIKGQVILLDPQDADLADYTWTLLTRNNNSPYLTRCSRKTKPNNILLHRAVMERILGRPLRRGERVDHKNRNGLDNRRENLRLATISQNRANSRIHSNNTAGMKGAHYHKQSGRWYSSITVNGHSYHLGTFATPEEAHQAYMTAARKYHGEFASDGRENLDSIGG